MVAASTNKAPSLAMQDFHTPRPTRPHKNPLISMHSSPRFSLHSLSTTDLSFSGQVIKALQSKQGVENGPLVILLLPHNVALVTAVMEQVHSHQKSVNNMDQMGLYVN